MEYYYEPIDGYLGIMNKETGKVEIIGTNKTIEPEMCEQIYFDGDYQEVEIHNKSVFERVSGKKTSR